MILITEELPLSVYPRDMVKRNLYHLSREGEYVASFRGRSGKIYYLIDVDQYPVPPLSNLFHLLKKRRTSLDS